MSKAKAIANSLKTSISKHGPALLTGVGIVGMIAAAVMAVRATPKALELIEEHKAEADSAELSPLEKAKASWKCYIPAAATGAASIACLIGANSIHAKRSAAFAAAYALSESALKEYQDKVIETIGEKKEQTIRDAVAKERVEKNPVSSREVIITEKGNTLCYDVISGRYFRSDIDKLKRAENELNRQLRDDMRVSLNDFYYEIGLSDVKIGDDLGWNIDNGYIDLKFSSQLAADGTPCLVVDYKVAPQYNYDIPF